MAKNLYTIKLHESLTEGNLRITRVPGGWIYEIDKNDNGTYNNIVFVPYKKEYNVLLPLGDFKLKNFFRL